MGDQSFKDDIGTFLKTNAIWMAIAVAVIILVVIVVILVSIKSKSKTNNKIETKSNSSWLSALGEKDNIIEVESKGSRLTLTLRDSSLINDDKLKELGVTSIIKMSNKVILVVEDNAAKIEYLLK